MNVGLLYAITTTMLTTNSFVALKEMMSWIGEDGQSQFAQIQKTETVETISKSDLKYIMMFENVHASLALEDLKVPSKEGLDFIKGKEGLPTKAELDMLGSIYQLPEGLLYSVMVKESNGNKYAVSEKNAKGLFQFTKETAEEFGLIVDGKDMRTSEWLSAETSARYLAWIFGYFHPQKDRNDMENYRYVLAGYNAGIGNVKKGNRLSIPNFKETQDYVRLVIGYAEGKYYKVKRGDTFKRIASKNGLSQSKLSMMNNGVSQHTLIAETYLLVDTSENDVKYTVQKGDSLYGIAKRHDLSIETLKVANALPNNIIKIGQTLLIPY